MTLKHPVNKFFNMSPKNKMLQVKITPPNYISLKMMISSLVIRRLGISGILIEALWIWDILVMGMGFSWKNWMLGPTGSSLDHYTV